MVVAAIVYHSQYLKYHFRQDSILRSSQLWLEDIPFFQEDRWCLSTHGTTRTAFLGCKDNNSGEHRYFARHRKYWSSRCMGVQRKMVESCRPNKQKTNLESNTVKRLDERDAGGPGYAQGTEIFDSAGGFFGRSRSCLLSYVCHPTYLRCRRLVIYLISAKMVGVFWKRRKWRSQDWRAAAYDSYGSSSNTPKSNW